MLYSLHPRPLQTLFSELEAYGLAQEHVSVGTAGSLLERTNASGFRFYAHQYYDAMGQKREQYVAGPVGSAEADGAAERLRSRIDDVTTILPSLRLLGREGFQLADSKTYATLAALHNHSLFAAGALLVGSHAYGALLNRLGIRAVSYQTEDIDIARARPLALGSGPRSLLEVLRDSRIEFVEVPQLDAREPATSYKQRGRSMFRVDILAPGRGEQIGTAVVPELDAHAVALPYLGYLLNQSQFTVVLAREGCCAVRVPLAERFAIHKLVVSGLRSGNAKALRDRAQAAVLCAALGELHAGAVESAVHDVPRGAMKYLRRSVAAIRKEMENHPRAWEELERALPAN